MFEKFQADWRSMSVAQRWLMGTLVVGGFSGVLIHHFMKQSAGVTPGPDVGTALTPATAPVDPQQPEYHARVALPESTRNQGLEDLTARIEQLGAQVAALKGGAGQAPTTSAPTSTSLSTTTTGATTEGAVPPAGVDLDALIPGPSFPADASSTLAGFKQPRHGAGVDGQDVHGSAQPEDAPASAPARMRIWDGDSNSNAGNSADKKRLAVEAETSFLIPVNSAIDSVMLSGFNARPTGSVAGAVGSAQTSANNVGAPFVTKIKGDAILPNGWRLSDLGECFLGGSAVAYLSTGRAYAIAENLSCISKSGEVYEAPIKAYALDVDGTLGIAGKVVSKQGSLLMQAALTGMAAGLGNALSPQSIPTYNSNGTNGSTASVQYPNLGAIGYSAVGQGATQAASQLSKFYLQYASEVFPVVEVVSATRVTWVLQETVELKRRDTPKEISQ